MNLILGKALGYAYYGDEFDNFFYKSLSEGMVYSGEDDTSDFYIYLNWNTPKINLLNKKIESGVYATAGGWHNGVIASYRQVAGWVKGDGNSERYSAYLKNLGTDFVERIVEKHLNRELPDVVFVNDNGIDQSPEKINGTYPLTGKYIISGEV